MKTADIKEKTLKIISYTVLNIIYFHKRLLRVK